MNKWTEDEIKILTENYPKIGKHNSCVLLNKKEHQIRYKASELGLRINKNSEFYKESIKKRALTVTGRKRPEQSKVMKELWIDGKIKPPAKKERICGYCGKVFFWENSKNHRKLCSDECVKNFFKNRWDNNPHPKGMLGKKHSEENTIKMSERVKLMWKDANSKINSKENSIKRSLRNVDMHNKGILGNCKTYSNRKYGYRTINGRRFFLRSSWEENVAIYFECLKVKGIIKDWDYEPKRFSFEYYEDSIYGYTPDFSITRRNGDVFYVEVKGIMDEKSKRKIEKFRNEYNNLSLIVIDEKRYYKIIPDDSVKFIKSVTIKSRKGDDDEVLLKIIENN